ncbi:MAG: hypothetical protein BMS9Abin02_1692 [Anaerolineae bacterium]|nr:MAG: hypothetical protein BMS9Abin02_1692 [Anaerolineae bacterium]
MNSIISEHYSLFELYQALREQLMEILSDSDLSYSPGGNNPPLGELCREIGEIETSYIQSFRNFKQEFNYRNSEPGLTSSVSSLREWFEELDSELKSTISDLSDEDLRSRLIDRGNDFQVSPRIQLEIYKEALLIFYGKSYVYLKAMGKELSQQWQDWIA